LAHGSVFLTLCVRAGWDALSAKGQFLRKCDRLYIRSYAGEIFIDVAFDEADGRYRKVQAFLEYPDCTSHFDDVRFYVISLELARENAHHDEPGFWDRWADNF
jgi:hypothetical protein